jgi:hypothetical protein
MTSQEIPVCNRCGDKVCQCMMSIPKEKRICSRCKHEEKREKSKAKRA